MKESKLGGLTQLGWTVWLMFCFLSCASTGKAEMIIMPTKPEEPSITWIHVPGGELLTYEEFRKLAEWVITTRGYIRDLEDSLTYYEEVR